MATSKAQQKATAKYNKANYDNLNIRIPKGTKVVLKELGEEFGLSLAGLIMWSLGQAYEDHLEGDTPPELREKVGEALKLAYRQVGKETNFFVD